MRQIAAFAVFALAGAASLTAQTTPSSAGQAPSDGDLYQLGRQLFDQYAPPDIKQQYEFPTKEQFDEFMTRLERALDEGSLDDLAEFEPEARAALAALRAMPDRADLADWLGARLDEIDEARAITEGGGKPGAPRNPEIRQGVPSPGSRGPSGPGENPAALTAGIPYYNRWLAREQGRPRPANAAELMPRLRRDFEAEGVPPEIAWLAEAESSLDSSARSPSGARGLFQMKADTARDLGLSTLFPDERTDPDKSAHAAARYLRGLGKEFGSWPLAFAAYNAGSGRVKRLLEERHASDYAGIAEALPAGTRMYVPKVCALIAVRAGVPPERIPGPAR
jgi:membrane-bound lytic murein transglycosylase D